ncbi:MAG TPA: hypothetical protein VGV60_05060 [Candidatus Polarisedimenticolia bacterium]|jgi:hypothetical protein|nr:hypothetical protein [Candidatus Polarisedimenticolia bacterium]
MRRKWRVGLLSVLSLASLIRGLSGMQLGGPVPPGGAEFDHLIPHVREACAVVREKPGIWPYRAFPYGPLGLEIRKAKSPAEADQTRGFYLGAVAGACGVPADEVTAYFFCGPACPGNRRDHLVRQLPAVKALKKEFEALPKARLVAIWAPGDEFRINDVFYMDGHAREAIPSPVMGFVPSGDWKAWPSLVAYARNIGIPESKLRDLTRQMRDIGLSALIRDPSGLRLVGVGIGDNESGLLFPRPAAVRPRVGAQWPDGRKYTIVEEVSAGVFYYETT